MDIIFKSNFIFERKESYEIFIWNQDLNLSENLEKIFKNNFGF